MSLSEFEKDLSAECCIFGCDSCKDRNTPRTGSMMNVFPENISLAMAYVPYQEWRDLYDETMALRQGTLFAELDKPFLGSEKRRCKR